MKTMITLLFSALCVATVSAQTDEKDNAMLNNGINFLDIPYVAHTLEVTDGEEELIINCDEVRLHHLCRIYSLLWPSLLPKTDR